jgi:hypothetical protein
MVSLSQAINLILAFVISFGFYYLIGWFISNEQNLFFWTTFGKIVYLILSGLMMIRLLDFFDKQYKQKKIE